jgi:UDPglucose 6-dehydrogenase
MKKKAAPAKKKGKGKKIGFIGLGKLGLPVALAMESKGHEIMGYDINPAVADYLKTKKIPYREEGSSALLKKNNIKLGSVADVVSFADLLFVPIQTPHHPKYEGIDKLTPDRTDFDYSFLINGIREIADTAKKLKKDTILVIISTVLPGTIDRDIRPLLNKYTRLVYEPLFIAMGTTINDFLYPEFVLMGVDDEAAARTVKNFYKTIHDRPVHETSIKSAELIKVAYNTYIGMKIVFANTMMEICHHTGADVDSVTKGMSLATNRLMSPKYMRGGMGDGGGCHPRDNIAMSWLAGELGLSHNIFDNLMMAREHQTEWLADLIVAEYEKSKLPIVILGKSFKPETNLMTGSPAILLSNILKERNLEFVHHDPFVDEEELKLKPSLYFLATQHETFNDYRFPSGSVVIDPFRYLKDKPKVKIVRVGAAPKKNPR